MVPSYAVVRPVESQAFLSFAEAEICREGDPAGAGQSEGFPPGFGGVQVCSEATIGWIRRYVLIFLLHVLFL